MKKEDPKKNNDSSSLRERAEKKLRPKTIDIKKLSEAEVRELAHELRVYQMELEMQNDELRTAQQQLGESRDKYSDLYNFSPLGYFTFNEDGLVKEVNLTGAELLGEERSLLLGKNFKKFVDPKSEDKFYLYLKDVFKTETLQTCEIKLNTNKKGYPFYARLESVVASSSVKPEQCRTSLSDITKEKLLQEQLFQIEKLSSLGTLTSGVAHELNNPLTAIQGFSELLSDEKELPKQILDTVLQIHNQAIRCSNIVKNLLSFSRQYELSKEKCNINDLINKVLELLSRQLDIDKIQVTTRFDQNLPEISGDCNKLQQVCVNIILNAQYEMVKHNKGGNLTIHTIGKGNCIRIILENDGPPIPEENLRKIFDPFYSTKEAGKGTGLGLSISFGIIRDHGGAIRVENVSEKGVRFIVELPKLIDKKIIKEKGQLLKKTIPKDMKVLIVDDEDYIRDYLSRVFIREGISPLTANSGQSAINLLKKIDFDIILSDARMPNMDGFDLHRWIKENHSGQLAKFVLMTGLIDPHVQEFCSHNNCYYLQKPFTKKDIFCLVGQALDESKHSKSK